MTIENNLGKSEKGPEVKWGGPEGLDGLTGRLVAMGLIAYESISHPLKESLVTIDFSRRSVSVKRFQGRMGVLSVRKVGKQNG